MRDFVKVLGLAVGAVGLTVTAASAQSTASGEAARGAAQPWYDRFTYSADIAPQSPPVPGLAGKSAETALSWAPSQRWGVTVNLRDATQDAPVAAGEASVGAFYHFSPRIRVGGQVSMAEAGARAPAAVRGRQPAGRTPAESEPSAGVKLQSAFKF